MKKMRYEFHSCNHRYAIFAHDGETIIPDDGSLYYDPLFFDDRKEFIRAVADLRKQGYVDIFTNNDRDEFNLKKIEIEAYPCNEICGLPEGKKCSYRKLRIGCLRTQDNSYICIFDRNEQQPPSGYRTGRAIKKMRYHYNLGRARYVLSFHDGEKKHCDGSDFYDIRIFKTRKKFIQAVAELRKQGYKDIWE